MKNNTVPSAAEGECCAEICDICGSCQVCTCDNNCHCPECLSACIDPDCGNVPHCTDCDTFEKSHRS